jgi:hypothetical protein
MCVRLLNSLICILSWLYVMHKFIIKDLAHAGRLIDHKQLFFHNYIIHARSSQCIRIQAALPRVCIVHAGHTHTIVYNIIHTLQYHDGIAQESAILGIDQAHALLVTCRDVITAVPATLVKL